MSFVFKLWERWLLHLIRYHCDSHWNCEVKYITNLRQFCFAFDSIFYMWSVKSLTSATHGENWVFWTPSKSAKEMKNICNWGIFSIFNNFALARIQLWSLRVTARYRFSPLSVGQSWDQSPFFHFSQAGSQLNVPLIRRRERSSHRNSQVLVMRGLWNI